MEPFTNDVHTVRGPQTWLFVLKKFLMSSFFTMSFPAFPVFVNEIHIDISTMLLSKILQRITNALANFSTCFHEYVVEGQSINFFSTERGEDG